MRMRLFKSLVLIQFWRLAWLAAVIPVQAQVNAPGYPMREIRSICQSAPGSGADILIRHYSEQLSKRLGKPVVVENMPGAQGKIATSAAARAKPDGYTILITPASASLAASKHIFKDLGYDPDKDFTPVALLGTGTLCLVVPSSSSANTLAEFLQMAKTSVKGVNYASPGNGTPQHLAMELLKFEAGLNLFHVPFKGSAGAVNDVAAGHVSAMIAPVHTVMPLVKAGKLKMLAVLSSERVPQMPQVPTFKEVGLEPVNRMAFYGIYGPKGLPKEVVDKVNAAVRKALEDPSVRKRIEDTGSIIIGNSPEQFAEQIKAEYAVYKQVVETAKLKLD
jgi:tripartite-type tricarboxylate transporter receptor subunit TctC